MNKWFSNPLLAPVIKVALVEALLIFLVQNE